MWWLPLACAIPLFLIWDVVHEGSHALAALIRGEKVLKFRPWPQRDGTRFRFGSVTTTGSGSTLQSLAPFIVDAVVALPLLVALALSSGLARSILVSILVGPVVDTVVAVQARYRGNSDADLAKVHWGWALVFLYLSMGYALILGWQLIP
jgi:hypothetical protein